MLRHADSGHLSITSATLKHRELTPRLHHLPFTGHARKYDLCRKVPSSDLGSFSRPVIMAGRSLKIKSYRAFSNLFELAHEFQKWEDDPATADLALNALQRVLEIKSGQARCKSTPELKDKFGVEEKNTQLVVCVRDIWAGNQVWWNAERTKKPQTFASDSQALPDSTDNGAKCDFCKWETLTAMDSFGRKENDSCVTASNLFKYTFPCHGLVLFKHHHPLQFNQRQVADLLAAASAWFEAAHKAHSSAKWPLLLWNCLPRAGASQFHGHAQTILTEDPTPAAEAWQSALELFERQEGQQLPDALKEAYQSVGLCREVRTEDKEKAFCFASLSPTKDMETVVVGNSLDCPAFAQLLFCALRALIDQLSVTSFNVAVLNIAPSPCAQKGPIIARLVSRGSLSSRASDFGALEVFGGASIGHTDPYAVIQALEVQMKEASGSMMAAKEMKPI